MRHSRSRALLATASAACLIALLAGCGSGSGTASSTASAGDAAAQASAAVAAGTVDPKSPMGQTLAYIQSGKRPTGNPKVAFIDACTSNTYCQAGLQGAKDASAKFGIDLTLYDSNFSSDTELKNVQDAVQKGYDGYVMAPLTQTTGCSNFKLLQATGKPVVNDNSPMCGNPDYTKGTSGFVAVQTAAYFQQHIENAFKSCTSSCKALVVDQGVTSDLYKLWETALTAAKAKYPMVDVVVDQPTDFVPETTLQVTQDALQKHSDISLVVSYWDDATRGAEQAIVAAGKTPGKDVRIYSMGATKDALAKIKAGTWNESTVLLPYEEGYYAFAQMARKLATGEDTPGYTDLSGAPSVASGPGSIFITAANADKFAPKY